MTTVVVIDDDDDIRQLVARKLTQAGFDTHEACDGEAGLALIVALQPELVLLDVMMPKLDGIEVLRRVRADADLNATPLILMTAKSQFVESIRGLDAEADDYIVKPFSPREMVGRVQALLAARGGVPEVT